MHAMRKTFPCGHRGRGQYCHRCQSEQTRRQQEKSKRENRSAELAAAPVDLSRVPVSVADRAIEVIAQLQAGKPYMVLRGKRLHRMGQRKIISVPVGKRWRLICRDSNGLQFIEVISHETYNQRLSAGGWK